MLKMRGWTGCIGSMNVDVRGSWSEAESPRMLGVVKHTETDWVGHKLVGDDVWARRVTRNGRVAWTEVSEASKGQQNEQMSHEGDRGALTQ